MENAARTNTQVVKECYGYFTQGNIPALLNELTDDIRWVSPGPKDILPWAGEWNGKAGVGEFFKQVAAGTDFKAFEPREFIAENNKVVAIGFMQGTSKKTGRSGKTNWAMVFTFRDGKVCNFEEFMDTYNGVEAHK